MVRVMDPDDDDTSSLQRADRYHDEIVGRIERIHVVANTTFRTADVRVLTERSTIFLDWGAASRQPPEDSPNRTRVEKYRAASHRRNYWMKCAATQEGSGSARRFRAPVFPARLFRGAQKPWTFRFAPEPCSIPASSDPPVYCSSGGGLPAVIGRIAHVCRRDENLEAGYASFKSAPSV